MLFIKKMCKVEGRERDKSFFHNKAMTSLFAVDSPIKPNASLFPFVCSVEFGCFMAVKYEVHPKGNESRERKETGKDRQTEQKMRKEQTHLLLPRRELAGWKSEERKKTVINSRH